MKKRQQNGRRKGPVKSEKEQREPAGEADFIEADAGGADEEMMDYLQMVTGLIEERVGTREEIDEMVSDVLRQHRESATDRLYCGSVEQEPAIGG